MCLFHHFKLGIGQQESQMMEPGLLDLLPLLEGLGDGLLPDGGESLKGSRRFFQQGSQSWPRLAESTFWFGGARDMKTLLAHMNTLKSFNSLYN